MSNREDLRHIRVMNKIKEAKDVKDLPKVGYNDIAIYLSSIEILGKNFSKEVFLPYIEVLKRNTSLVSQDVKLAFKIIFSDLYSDYSDGFDEILEQQYTNLVSDGKLGNLLEEIKEMEKFKLQDSIDKENERHESVVTQIEKAKSIEELPSISFNDVARELASETYCGEKISPREFCSIVDIIKENGSSHYKIYYAIMEIVRKKNDTLFIKPTMDEVRRIYNGLLAKGKIDHLYEEIKMINEKKEEFLKQEEDRRHSEVLRKIEEAKSIEELPKVNYSDISKYLASEDYYGVKIKQSEFKQYVLSLIIYGNIRNNALFADFYEVLERNVFHSFNNSSIEKIKEKYKKIIEDGRIIKILEEIQMKNEKKRLLLNDETLKNHEEVMKQISSAFEEKDLPKVGIGELNKRILKIVNSNSFDVKFKVGDISDIAKCYLSNDLSNLEEKLKGLLNEYVSCNFFDDLFYEIYGAFLQDESLSLVAEEIIAIEQRRRKIYEMDHDEIMDLLNEATRMYQLPSISFSSLTSYLCGNSTIYPNDNSFKSEHFKKLTELLLAGKKWEDKEVIDELKRICDLVYPGRSNAFDLLFKKLTSLPKTYYLVDEINLIRNLQKEFIENGQSNVNVYFVENPKAPKEGGKFYNVYINRVEKLDLYQVLPLDLNSIVAPGTDIDAVEWLVGKKDKTFKKVGGIILYRDETIGDITVYRVNDGRISITSEDKDKLDRISDLDSQISSKEDRIKELDEMIKVREAEVAKLIQDREIRERDRLYISKAVEQVVSSSREKLRMLQQEIGDSLKWLDDVEAGTVKKLEPPKE